MSEGKEAGAPPKPPPKPEPPSASAPPPPKPRRKRQAARQPLGNGASPEARQAASVVLEVLGGSLGPGEAAALLGISGTQYYKVEQRALAGLVAGCEPRQKGRGRVKTAATELAALQKAHAKLERECARLQALVRSMSRVAGVKGRSRVTKSKDAKDTKGAKGTRGKKGAKGAKKTKGRGRGRRGRQPTVRALRFAGQLRENPPVATPGDGGQGKGHHERTEQPEKTV